MPKKKAPPAGKEPPFSAKKPPARKARTPAARPSFPIVGIGASAGGLETLETLFKAMPPDSGIGFVLVVHLDRTHVSMLPELLQKYTPMPVRQVEDGMLVEPNHVYVIPPNKDLTIVHGTLHLTELVEPRGAKLPIDSFFRSLAQDQGTSASGIILSGTGTDGTLGVKAIKSSVGMVMVQSEETAKYGGMPRSAIATGVVDYVLAPDQMPEQLIRYTRHATGEAAPRVVPPDGPLPAALQKIFAVLRARNQHDFSLYKKNTVCRRIERRMNVHQIDDIAGYVRYLQESDREADALFKELLIGVTNFFRDPEAFRVLQDEALPAILEAKPNDYSVRIWVPGCASGEEAYSVAILLDEGMERLGHRHAVQIFGTDLDPDAIAVARTGTYPASITADVEAKRLERYFAEQDDGKYRVIKRIREMIVFAQQNVITDPPFTTLDLICCRNLLIYLEPELQERLLRTFHYALKSDGVLFLGSSETIGASSKLFHTVHRKWRIFRRKPSTRTEIPVHVPMPSEPYKGRDLAAPRAVQRAEELSALQLAEVILQQSDAPPCAIINDALDVVYIHGRTGRFLEPAEGKVSVNILAMARAGLRNELADAIGHVAADKQEKVLRGLRVEHNGGHVVVDVSVRPVLTPMTIHGLMMVVFEERPASSEMSAVKKVRAKGIEELEQELHRSRQSLQNTIEELETSNEEFRSANEELQSTNEELQSTNEEMETSKEELQSLNEESVTVNAELQARIDELSETTDDMKNLLDSTDIATLFLDTEMRIRRFTPSVTKIISLTAADIGRPIHHFASALIDTDLTGLGQQVLDDLIVREAEVEGENDRLFTLRVRPYRTVMNVIDGVVMTFTDETARRRAEQELRESEALHRLLFENASVGIGYYTTDGKIIAANTLAGTHLGLTTDLVPGKTLPAVLGTEAAKVFHDRILEAAQSGNTRVSEDQVAGSGGRRSIVSTIAVLQDPDMKSGGVLVVTADKDDSKAGAVETT